MQTNHTPSQDGEAQGLNPLLTFAMAGAAGIAVANIYYNQPMLGLIEDSFRSSSLPTFVPTATQLGYALALFFLVPLGDLTDRRRLIVGQFVVLAAALAVLAWVPSAGLLIAVSILVGACSTVAQHIVPFAASLARPETRGRAVGAVMAGLLTGILASRTLAGFVAAHFGWRMMFWLAVPLALAGAVAMARLLPRHRSSGSVRYGAAMESLITLWLHEPALRTAALAQAGLFGAFSIFWTVLVLHLQEPSFGLGADAAGLFGIVGIVGVIAAPVAGRLSDRKGPALVILLGAALTLASWVVFGFWDNVLGLGIGVVVLDFGVQSAMVSHQHIVFALNPEARSRLNTLFMTAIFLGGSAGSAGATFAWSAAGWPGVCVLGGAFALFSLSVRLFLAR